MKYTMLETTTNLRGRISLQRQGENNLEDE